jgi:DNA-directed RNA polymerase subunit RPC12/RpoP
MAYVCDVCKKEFEGNRELMEHYIFEHKGEKPFHMVIIKRYIQKCIKCQKLILDHNDEHIIGGDDHANALFIHYACATPEEQKWLDSHGD